MSKYTTRLVTIELPSEIVAAFQVEAMRRGLFMKDVLPEVVEKFMREYAARGESQ